MGKRIAAYTKEQIADYAEASGDFNKIHTDESFARSAGFPTVIAHGMLSMGVVSQKLIEGGLDPKNFQFFDCKFKEIVLPGEELELESEKTEQQVEFSLKKSGGIEVCSGRIRLKS